MLLSIIAVAVADEDSIVMVAILRAWTAFDNAQWLEDVFVVHLRE